MLNKTTMSFLRVYLLILFSLFIFINSKAQSDFQSATRAFLKTALDSFPGVPGIDIVVVKDDDILFRESAGYADVETKTPFSAKTEMYIASNTKSFVGLALAKLITENRISPNDPISKYIDPGYFPDSINIGNIYIHDLAGHTHGLSNDVMTFRTAFTGTAPDSLLPELLRFTSYYFHPPAKKFRYSNFSYLLAGMVIQQVTGISWRDYLKDSLLYAAGMRHTTPYISEIGSNNLAAPYRFDQPGHRLSLMKRDNTMHSAGGLVTTSGDMAKWLEMFLNDGVIDNKIAMDPDYFKTAKTILVADTGNMGPFRRFGYSYGWLFGDFNGEKLYFHFGGYPGYGSMMSFMPEKHLGIFAFTNEGAAGIYLSALVSSYVYDQLLEKKNTGDISNMIMEYIRKTYSKKQKDTLSLADPKEFPFGNHTNFISRAYGDLEIFRVGDSMKVRLGNLESPVYDGDTADQFFIRWIPGDPEKIRVERSSQGIAIKYEDYTTFYQE